MTKLEVDIYGGALTERDKHYSTCCFGPGSEP
jgi:hypothetical protein